MKKFLSVFLSLAILVGSLSVANIFGFNIFATNPNLIVNSDFESGTTGWYWSKGVSTEQYHGGAQSLQIGTGNYTRSFHCVNVTPNTDYVYSFWYYAPTGGSWWGEGWHVNGAPSNVDKANPVAYLYNAANVSKLAGGSYSKCDTGVWKQATVNFNSGSHEVAVLEFTNHESKEIYIDDVSLTLASANTDEDQLIKNGDIENGTKDWYWSYGTTTEQVYKGNSSLIVNDGTGEYKHTFQCVDVTPNTDYKLKFWYYAPSGEGWRTALYINGAPANVDKTNPTSYFLSGDYTIATFKYEVCEANNWKEAVVTFNSGNYDVLVLDFSSHNKAIYIDEVSLKTYTPDTGIIKNGSFESETDYWSGSATITKDEHYDGQASIKLPTTNYSKVMQEFTVTPNTNYTMTFYYKGTSTWMNKWAVRDTTATNPEQNESIIQGALASKTDWTEVTEHFNSGDNESLYFIIMSGSGANVYLDNVSIVLKPYDIEDDLLIKNYSFERGKEKWTGINDNTISVTNEQSAVGEYSLKLKDGNYIKAYQGFEVEKNTDYIVNFKCYAPTANWATKWGIAVGAGQSVDATAAGRLCGANIVQSNTWQDVMVKFNSGDNQKLHIIFQGYGGTEYYIDEVFVIKADAIVLNGSFETNLIGWNTDDGSFTVTEEEKYEGIRAINAKEGYYSKLSQLIAVEKQTNYKLTFRYKGTINAVIPNFAIAHTSASFEEGYLLKKGSLTTVEDWTEASVIFNSGDNESLYLLFQTTVGCNYFIDSVVVQKTDEKAEEFTQGVTPKFGGVHRSPRYAYTDGTNLVTDAGFENGDGNWKNLLFDGVLTVTDENVKNGSKALKFDAKDLEKDSLNAFYVEVEPNTDYIFSTWVYGTRRSAENRTDMEFGVIDVNTGKFLPSIGNGNTDRVYTTEHQLTPLSWDDEWHITGLTFNSGTATHIGIMIKGADSVAYFDDMYVCKLEEAQVFVAPEDAKADNKITNLEPTLLGCDNEDNLIKNFDFSDSNSDFWQTGKVFGNQVTIKNTGGTKGNALHYSSVSKYPYRTYYIKYVNVEPNTEYTFSAKYQILKSGDGFFGIINGNKKLPTTTIQYVFDESRFNSDYKWQTVGFTFKTGGYDRLGIVVFDGGGEAFIDDMRLFKTSDAKMLVETDDFPTTITSETYTVANGKLTGISENTTLKTLLSRLNEGKYVRVFNGETEITDLSKLAATDLEIRLMDGYEIKQRLRLIVTGDINSDGKITTLDSDIILKYLTKQTELSGNKAEAADVDNDGKVTMHDAVRIIAHAVGKTKIK